MLDEPTDDYTSRLLVGHAVARDRDGVIDRRRRASSPAPSRRATRPSATAFAAAADGVADAPSPPGWTAVWPCDLWGGAAAFGARGGHGALFSGTKGVVATALLAARRARRARPGRAGRRPLARVRGRRQGRGSRSRRCSPTRPGCPAVERPLERSRPGRSARARRRRSQPRRRCSSRAARPTTRSPGAWLASELALRAGGSTLGAGRRATRLAGPLGLDLQHRARPDRPAWPHAWCGRAWPRDTA